MAGTTLQLRDLIKRRPLTVDGGATIRDVVKIMALEDVGFLIVKEREEVVGVLSERDVIKALAEGEDLGKKVGSLCKRDVITLRDNSTLEEAAQLMGKQRIRHIVVVDVTGEVVGVVSVKDLLEELFSPGPMGE
ncbi:MAG: CBS domain-containing protein [Thaumarchaeota archaeon]|nr:CBS domain-containing protein [Candidatus Calditenuaceae archaeon]MDW8187207.1 CBS domain-containing protein [Nitrososphaerota archaeon]